MRRTSIKQLLQLWGPVLVWMAVIFWFSAQSDLPHAPGGLLDFIIKKMAHATVYAVLTALVWRALHRRGTDSSTRQTKWPVPTRIRAYNFALPLLYAISDEWHQVFVPGRHARPFDVLVDTSGILLALLLIERWRVRDHLKGDVAKQPFLADDEVPALDHRQHGQKRGDHFLTR